MAMLRRALLRSAGGVAIAPRNEGRLSPERWEFSPLCGRRPVGTQPAGAELEITVVWRVGVCDAGLGHCLLWSTKETIPKSEAPRRSGWQPGISSTSRSWGAPPQEEEETSADQLQALFHRIVMLGNVPYVDHAVWGPSGRRTARADKFRTWIPTSDGSYISKELPGSESFSAGALVVEGVRGGGHHAGP